MTFLKTLLKALDELLWALVKGDAPLPPEPHPVPPTPNPPIMPALDWSNVQAIKSSIRKICKEEGLTLEQTDTLVATIGGESQYLLTAKNVNRRKDGSVASTDWGLCQWNDYYHGKEITPEEAVHNPEKAVRLMATYWKMGETYRRWWIAYKNNSYLKYM